MKPAPHDSAVADMIGPTKGDQWYLSGKVGRYHTHYGIDQTNADHQWGVALFILLYHPNPSRSLLIAALTHDMPELITGDPPAPSKRFFPELTALHDRIEGVAARMLGLPEVELTKEEGLWLKLADRYECQIHAHHCVPEPFRSRLDIAKVNRLIEGICEELGITHIPYPGSSTKFYGVTE